MKKYEVFKERCNSFGSYANERNCSLYVDAEQSFIQYGIESFGQQLTHKYNVKEKHLIMNGYQCYTKRSEHLVPMEVLCAKTYGYNLGIKLIRGAYMNEERHSAQTHGYESPIHETIQDTHDCYNNNMKHILSNLAQNDGVLIGSHNLESVELAKNLIKEYSVNSNVIFG